VPALDGLRSGSCAANQWRDSVRSIGIFRPARLAGGLERNFFWGRRIVRPRRLLVIATSLRTGAQPFGHTRCEPVRMPKTIVPQGFP
jgi:hypothetical protein